MSARQSRQTVRTSTTVDAFGTLGVSKARNIAFNAVGAAFVTGRWVDSVENWWLTRKLGQ